MTSRESAIVQSLCTESSPRRSRYFRPSGRTGEKTPRTQLRSSEFRCAEHISIGK